MKMKPWSGVCVFVCIVLVLCVQLRCGEAFSGEVAAEDSPPAHVHLGHLLQRINKTVDDVVDKPVEDLMRVYHGGNSCPFHRKVVSKLQRNEKVKVMVLGGSVTYGADLPDRLNQRWSNHFNDIMNDNHWYKGGFDVVNLGVGACNVNVWVWRAREFAAADLVVVDLSVNDQGFELSELPMWYENLIQVLDALPNPPALLFHQAFRSGQRKEVEVARNCPAKAEQMTCCDGVLFCKKWYDMHDYVVEALQKYQVPFVSYRDLVWPNYSQPSSSLNLFWNGLSHPDYKAHALIAKLVATGVMMEVKEAHRRREFCKTHPEMDHYVTGKLKEKAAPSLCLQTKTHMLASDSVDSRSSFTLHDQASSSTPVMEVNHWTFTNDTANKFGWILRSNKQVVQEVCKADNWCDAMIPSHTISLDIEVGDANPVIQLFYLSSHSENMGKALVWVDDKMEEHAVLESQLDLPYSVTKVVTIAKQDLGGLGATKRGGTVLFPSLSAGKHVLHISVQDFPKDKGYKWKLLGVTTC